MTGIGPVEEYDPGDDSPPPADAIGTDSPRPADVIGTDSPRLHERWAALPPRRRRTALLLAAVAAAVTALLLLRPTPADPAPSPPPADATLLDYDGPGMENGTFRFTVRVSSGSPVTLRRLDAWIPELGASTTPRLPLTVKAGEPRFLVVWLSIYHCPGLPRDLDQPRLELTLRNQRAQQQHSFVFGDPLSRDLLAFLRANCGPAMPPPAPAPPAGTLRPISHGSNTQLPLSQ
ncbi:hypothetical protein ACIBL6_01390 [Streptomyces sp. NPDC050400]|uniref:hypothetical protein n=1 Tax=Streptomyces sp. NPDC050400 TaxID=3365610 RepID=UPI003790B47C